MTSSDCISWETVQFSYLLDLSAEFDQLATSYFLTHTGSVVTITLFFSNSSPKFLTVPIQPPPLLDSLSSSTDLLHLYEVVISVSMTHLDMPSANLTCLKTYTSNGYLSSASLVPHIQCMPRIKPTIPSPNLLLLQGWLFLSILLNNHLTPPVLLLLHIVCHQILLRLSATSVWLTYSSHLPYSKLLSPLFYKTCAVKWSNLAS